MKKLRDHISVDIGSEVAIGQVIKTLSVKRLVNAVKISASFIISMLFKKAIVWGIPPIVNVEPTNLCNLKCPLCTTGSGDMQRPRGKMNFELYRTFVDQVADRAIYMTLYHQGEPYLLKDFNRFVRYAKDQGMYVNTSTNAHFFDKESAGDVVASGLDSMIISLDGVTQESYSRYRVGGSLQTVLDGIRSLVAAKKQAGSKTPYLFLQFLVMKHNEAEIAAVKILADQLGVDRLLIKTIQVMTAGEARQWLPENDKYRRYNLANSRLSVKRGTGACPRLWLTTLVDWDGPVVPCCFDKNGQYVMGHIEKGDQFTKIWRSPKYMAFRDRMLKHRNSIDICRNCNYGIGIFT